jgi:cytochrome P450
MFTMRSLTSTITTLDDAAARAREDTVVWLQNQFEAHAEDLLGVARRRWPIPRVFGTVVVTRRDDVLAVLADTAHFALPYGPRLPGRFVLGLTGAALERDQAELRAVVRPDDLEFLKGLAESEAERRVAAAAAIGGLDVGSGLVHPVLDTVVARYLGVAAPDPVTGLRWSRDLFQDLFLNVAGLASVRRRAQRAATEMGSHIDHLIAARRAAPDRPDDVLGRLLDRQHVAPETALSDTEIRTSLIGLALGWLWHGAKAPLIALDELLDRPDAFDAARAAARARDPEALRRVLWEVLRFRPVQAGVNRVCIRDTTIAPGTAWERRVRAGTPVLVGTHSAMWDETAVPDPAVFDPTRAEGQYLIFGDGLHRCFGERIVRVQLPAMLGPLLRADGLRRAPGAEGKLRRQGPSPDGFRVELSP